MLIKKILDLKITLKKHEGKKIAFVPTMGALHDGHLALVKKAREVADVVVVSIFVNKTQFNDIKDFEKYPRQLERDLEKLRDADYIFAPNDEEIFPLKTSFKIIPIELTDCLCGRTRAGHFDGVALIITKLFNIVKPNIALFGKKDFQQFLIIKKLVVDFNFEVEILGHEIVREKSGLAMSSRNQNLDESAKNKAAEIFKVLKEIKEEVEINPQNINLILEKKQRKLLESGFEKIDYLEIRDEKNLDLVTNFSDKITARIFVAVYLQGVRLIDNLAL